MSPKYTINSYDLLKTLENGVIFLLPILLANQAQITVYLANLGVNATFSAALLSIVIYLARQFTAGETTTTQTVDADSATPATSTITVDVPVNPV